MGFGKITISQPVVILPQPPGFLLCARCCVRPTSSAVRERQSPPGRGHFSEKGRYHRDSSRETLHSSRGPRRHGVCRQKLHLQDQSGGIPPGRKAPHSIFSLSEGILQGLSPERTQTILSEGFKGAFAARSCLSNPSG